MERWQEEQQAFRKGDHSGQPLSIGYPEVIRMLLLQDGVIAFLSAVGLTAIVWLVAGAFLHAGRPMVPGVLLVLPLRGDAPAMEADLRELRRLRRQLPGAKILLADCGLNDDARALAAYLADRTEGTALADGAQIRLE